MKRSILFLFIILFLTFFSQAQEANIAGRVIDDANLPLTGASVQLSVDHGAITDANGYFQIAGLSRGAHTITISYLGYETKTIDINLQGDLDQIFRLSPGLTLQEIVVTSALFGQARALNTQLTNDNITNVIAADQIGRFPDANVGDAMKRIPGINVQYDQGEARFGNIRGTAPQLNSVTLNGERIPSAEAEDRTIQLDLIPSDMIQAIEVNKAVTPDMDGDAIGGSVNLVTRAAPADRRISMTFGGGYNMIAEKPSVNGSFIIGDRFVNDKLGIIASASYFNNELGSDNIEAEWTYDDANDNDRFDNGEVVWPEVFENRQYYLQRVRQSYSLSLDYRVNPNHTFYAKGIYNRRKDWEERYVSAYEDIEEDNGQWVAALVRENKSGLEENKYARLEDQDMMTYSLAGNHRFGKLRTDWSVAYSRASEDRPHERYYELETDGTVAVDVDFSDSELPMITAQELAFQGPSDSWELKGLTEEHQYTKDEDVNARLDFTLPLNTGTSGSLIKFGGRWRDKEKLRDNDFYEYEPVSGNLVSESLNFLTDISKDNFLAGDYLIGQFPTNEFVGNLNLESNQFEKEQDLSELAGNFNATEQILAGYAMIKYRFNPKFQALAGVRIEQTDLEYSGFQYDDELETLTATAAEKNNYVNVLPGLHLKYDINPNSILRFAFTNTLARPNYFDLVPYQEIEDGEELSIGNPELNATTSTNIDLMFEKYFGRVGIFSAGVFYKSIEDFIVSRSLDDYNYNGMEWASFSQPINGGNATLIGLEFAFQKQLDFISKNLGVYLNYTYINSEVKDFNIEGREADDLALPGSPEHTLNASLSYDAKNWSIRTSFNYASDFIDEFAEEAFGDRYYDEATYLDINLNYSVTDRLVIYGNANNILNQPLRYYQGIGSRTMQAEYYNVRFDLGIKYDISK